MNGTVNPLYGGNNMNGGAANKLQAEQDKTDTTQQNMLYQGQQIANRISQKSLAEQPKQRAQQYDSLNTNIRHSLGSRAKNSPMQAMAQSTAANIYRKAPGVDSVGKVFADVTKDIKHTSNITSDKISSIIFTVMQALSNSFTGGMNGMKAELDKISSEQEGGDDNAMVSFLADCGNFLNFFIQYSTINKQLQYKITHPDDDDLLAPQQKEYIRGIKEQLEDKTEFPENKKLFGNSNTITDNLNNQIINPTTYFYGVEDNKSQWIKYEDENSIKNGRNLSEEKIAEIEKDILKQRKRYLKKLNNIELEFYQEKLNNAFQYLTYTYGQLSGRTLYNLSKLLAAGGAKDVGLFAPISLPSLTGSAMRMVPGAGPVLDTINDFFSAFAMAFKMSYKTLKPERNLATDYIDTTAKESNEKLRKLHTGGGNKVEYIDKNTFRKITGKKEKNKLTEQEKKFNDRAIKISGNKGDHRLSKGDGRVFSKAKAERDLEMLNQILYDYNHLMSLKELFERFDRKKTKMLQTENVFDFTAEKDINYYIGKEKKNDKIKKINKEELKALISNDDLKIEFGKLVKLLDDLGGNVDSNEKKSDESPIEINNPMLYNIVKQFIKTTYDGLGGKKDIENLPDNNGIKMGLFGLIQLIDKPFDTQNENTTKHINDYIDKFLKKQENKKENKKEKTDEKQEKDETEQIKKQITELKKIIQDENNRIKELNNNGEGEKGKAKQERIREMIERQKKILNENLEKYRAMEIQAINDEIVASNSFKPLKKLLSKYRSTLKTKIQEMISALKSNENMYNTDKVEGTGNIVSLGRKTQLETDKLIRSALEKILNFIAIKNFKAFNEAASKIESGMKSLMSSGGSMRSSTIKRRIKKATRRIQLSLDEFNSGRNTRRGRYRKKPRKTRRVNYGH